MGAIEPTPSDDGAVIVERLSYTYAGRDLPSLDEVSCQLAPGKFALLAGRTGSGKSTLLRALAGLIPRHAAGTMQGRAVLFGLDTRQASAAELACTVGLVLQSPDDQLCTATVTAEVAFGLENLCLPAREIARRIESSLRWAGLTGLESEPTHHLSGGQKQRLLLAAVLAMRPRLLLLDEPLSQLDSTAAAELLATLDELRRQGLTLIVAEHRLDEIFPHCDQVLVVDRGRLTADLPACDMARVGAALEAAGLAPPEVAQLSVALHVPPTRTTDELVRTLGVQRPPRRTHVGRKPAANAEFLMRIESLSHRFPDAAWPLFQEVSFDLYQRQRVALVGPNGSGKSTLLSLIRERARISLVAPLVVQNCDLMLFCASVYEELAFAPRQLGLPPEEVAARAFHAARELELEELIEDPPQALSQGQRLRTAVAAVLTLAPSLLLLDEPTTGQDQHQLTRVMTALEQEDRFPVSILFSTHDLRSVARHADRVLVLADGRLIADCTPEELLRDDALLTAARLRRPPLFEAAHRLGLSGWTVEDLAESFRHREAGETTP